MAGFLFPMAGFFDYNPGLSTTNILYNVQGKGTLFYLNWCATPSISPLLNSLHPSSTPLSSSDGLVVCCNLMSDYCICNPFNQEDQELVVCYTVLPNPPRHRPSDSTHVVLATHIAPDTAPVFCVICAAGGQ